MTSPATRALMVLAIIAAMLVARRWLREDE